MHSPKLKKECRKLRRQGRSLNDIAKLKRLAKTTVYEWIRNIKLSSIAQKRLWDNYVNKIIKANKNKENFGFKRRKIENKPRYWSKDLIAIASHFSFDGEITKGSCIYSNRSRFQINRMQKLMKDNFNLDPLILAKPDGVFRISYHYVDLAEYMKKKAEDLLSYISTASKDKKRIFLQAFFDDEGCISCAGGYNGYRQRRIRGYQYSKEILELIKRLLKAFSIKGKIDKRYTEICISRRLNLVRF
ncbi:MAG: LAGLIDADG family homing endonuclease [Candidatus Portnoybacteria bacterium]|nr:LAGLIDADG family homing endonuclease [Candidatus Portnoybacteria bacterium]